MKKILLAAVIAIVVLGIAGYFFYQSKQSHYSLATVERGAIIQQVLATGNLQSPTTIDLAFQNAGKLTVLNARVGQRVAAGDTLAKQDTSVLQAQLRQAEANVAAQTAQLQQLQSGATPQSIAVARAAVANAEQTLANIYTGAPSTIDDAYTKANDAVRNQLASFFSSPESANPRLTFLINNSQVLNEIQSARTTAGVELNAWQSEINGMTATASTSILGTALRQASSHLALIKDLTNLSLAALTDEVGLDPATVAAYKTSATAGSAEVNAAVTAMSTVQQLIASGRAGVAQAEADLGLAAASSTPQNIQAQEAQIAQATASASAIKAQIDQANLVAPSDGIITDTHGSVGENIMPGVSVVSLMPKNALEVKVNVAEENIVGVHVGQPAQISLDAFPAETAWTGKVVSIDPAQTIVGGAVYYQTTILFDKPDPGMKPGMTANVLIETGSASSTLFVPASAIQRNSTTTFIQVYRDKTFTDQAVTTGLKSQSGMIEILSGAQEGEQIVTGS